MPRLSRTFFQRSAITVARELLGQKLIHEADGRKLGGIIVETEAYTGFDDAASHAFRGRTDRNAAMFGPAGVSYIYLIYGRYWLFNVVARPVEAAYPAAVLLRALEPFEGLDDIRRNRESRPRREWTSGPGRLTLGLGIDQTYDGLDMMQPDSPMYFEEGQRPEQISRGPRAGLGRSVTEPWRSKEWRFWITDNPFVSRT